MNAHKIIFIHGLEGSSQGFKAKLLGDIFPDIVIPDFRGSLQVRMENLESILLENRSDDDPVKKWIIIGSSFGGLMGAIFTYKYPHLVKKLILLAPALIWPEFAVSPPDPVSVPTVVFHGKQDDLIPLELIEPLIKSVFTNHKLHLVNDNHGLGKTAQLIDWAALI